MQRKTLTSWPTSLLDAGGWWLYVAAPDYGRIPGWFRHDDHGRIIFECENGVALGEGTFYDGERFEPCEAFDLNHKDPRIAALEGELGGAQKKAATHKALLDEILNYVSWMGTVHLYRHATTHEEILPILKAVQAEVDAAILALQPDMDPCRVGLRDGTRRALLERQQLASLRGLRSQFTAPQEPFPWKRLGFVHDGARVTSVTAARDEDGIGVVASWDLGRDEVWRLCGWGCTEDHKGPDTSKEDPLPETPPLCLLTVPSV